MPALTLSIASLAVFCATLGYLNRSPMSRTFFRLPFNPVFVALPALIVALRVLERGRRRPGSLFPRVWGLVLVLVLGATTVWAAIDQLVVPRGRPLVHTLAVAGLTATAVLALRLVKVRPDHWLVHHVSLIAVGLVLALAVPLILLIETQAVRGELQRLEDTFAALHGALETVLGIEGEDWRAASGDPGRAQARLDELRSLSLRGGTLDRYVWEGATLLHRDEQLAAVSHQLLDAILAALTSPRAPLLALPAVAYNRPAAGSGAWQPHASFLGVAKLTTDYHRELGRLFRAVVALTDSADVPAAGPLRAHRDDAVKRFNEHAAGLAGTWGRHWLAPVLDGRPPGASVATLIDLPLAPAGKVRASELAKVMSLAQGDVVSLERDDSTCRERQYPEGPNTYYTMNCYTYEATADGGGARMLVEYRIVYVYTPKRATVESKRPVAGPKRPAVESKPPDVDPSQKPNEVYMMFFVGDRKLESYAPEVMQALSSAVERHYGTRPTTPRGGPPTDGFFFSTAAHRFHVARITKDSGLPAVQVRVVCSPPCR